MSAFQRDRWRVDLRKTKMNFARTSETRITKRTEVDFANHQRAILHEPCDRYGVDFRDEGEGGASARRRDVLAVDRVLDGEGDSK